MNGYEPLGTGTLLSVDGRRAGPGKLAEPDELDALLTDLAADLGAGEAACAARIVTSDGSSHALVLDEAWLVLHAFPLEGAFSFRAFSRHALTDVELFGRVLRVLESGRFESTLRHRAAGLPTGEEALRRRLGGERAWARARLVDPPAAPA